MGASICCQQPPKTLPSEPGSATTCSTEESRTADERGEVWPGDRRAAPAKVPSSCASLAVTEFDGVLPTVLAMPADALGLAADAERGKKTGTAEHPGDQTDTAGIALEGLIDGGSAVRPGESLSGDALEAELEVVNDLCGRLQFLEAGNRLIALDRDAAAAPPGSAVESLRARLATPFFENLRAVHARIAGALREVMAPALRQDLDWSVLTVEDKSLFQDYRLDLKLRHLSDAERDKAGPSTQLAMCGHIRNFPLPIEGRVALEREADLFQKEWLKDCEFILAKASGPENCFSTFYMVGLAPKLLPFKLEDVMIRDFAMCLKSPMPGMPAGILKTETDPPEGLTSYNGMSIPAVKKGTNRLLGSKAFYICPGTKKGCCDVLIMAKPGASVPSWLVPLALIKRILAMQVSSALRSIKENVLTKWDKTDYPKRILENPGFYGPMAELRSPSNAPA